MRILVMGLSGSGKTELSKSLIKRLPSFILVNADDVRKTHDDWDFSTEGRIRQAKRLRQYCLYNTIVDTIAPLQEQRDIIDPDFIIWMDTKVNSKYEDTDKIFDKPKSYDLRITDFNYDVNQILENINGKKMGST